MDCKVTIYFFANAIDYLAPLVYFDSRENTFMLSYCQKKNSLAKKKAFSQSFTVFQVFSEVAAPGEVILRNILSLSYA